MDWQLSPYFAPLLFTGLITLTSAIFAFRRRRLPGSSNMLALLLAITIWVFAYGLELNAVRLEDKLFWAKVQYFGIVYLPVGYAIFALKYTSEFQKLKKPRQFTAFLLIIPLLTLILAWTNDWHGLVWKTTTLIQQEGLNYLAIEHGVWFWVNIGFVYLLLAGSTFLLLRRIVASPNQFRGQIVLIVFGSLCPWLGNILYITDSNPFPNLDLTPFAFALTALCFTMALYHFGFLDIVPIAREMVIEKLESGVIVLDSQNRVVDINKTAVTLLQQDKNKIVGQPLAFNYPAWTPLDQALRKNQTAQVDLAIDQTYYEASIIPIENVNDRAHGRLITLTNVTRRKEAELLLRKAKNTAEAADRAKTHFITNISHEIRTPLNAVVGMAEMLRQTNLNPNQNEMVNVVALSSHSLMMLINNILDFSRLEAGNLQLNHQSFSLVDCVEASIESVRRSASEKLLQLDYNITQETPLWLVGDPVRLRQIMVNLLENSIKFSEEGSIHLKISHVQDNDAVMLHFVVEDSGIGIDPDQISRMFLPFQQGDGSLTRSHGGSGLGLVICKRLVELMDGDIYLHSEVGQGTRVHFSVQLSTATEADPPAVVLRQNSASLAGRRLLIVTSSADQRRQISKEARQVGLEVYVAGGAQEATYWIGHSAPFDVVFLDTALWESDPAIMAQLKNSETHAPLPVILLGHGEEALRQITSVEPDLFAGTLPLPIAGPQMYDLLLNTLSVSNGSPKSRDPGDSMAISYPLNILLVEDNKLNRRIITGMMDKLGYSIDTAVNGRVAVEMNLHTAYDIILMDIQMPEMDGVEATKQILANCAGKRRPYIIAVTAHALPGDREVYLAAGLNEYLSKPVTINQLVEALYHGIEFFDKNTNLSHTQLEPKAPMILTNHPIDLEELARLVGDDTGEFLAMMTPIFLEDTQNLMKTLKGAVNNLENQSILQAAHTLKGTSASMAMTRLSQLCRELEIMAKNGDTKEAAQKFIQIEAEYQRVEAALATLGEAIA